MCVRTLLPCCELGGFTASLPTNIVGSQGVRLEHNLKLKGGIPRPRGDSPESLSQAMLVGVMLVGRSGVKGPPLKVHFEHAA